MLIGAHESIAGGVSRAFVRAQEHGAKSLQIFTKSARGWAAPPLADGEQALFRAEARRTKLPAIAHGSYLCNLASDDAALWQRSVDNLTDELQRCERLGVSDLVIHPGSHPDEQQGLRRIAQGLDEVCARTPRFRARICLEGTAGQGSCLGHRFEHLAWLLDHVKKPERLGICLDTCHLHAAGYDIRTVRGYQKVMRELDDTLGLSQVKCFHLNDCKKELGCRVDRHEEIGKGTLGLVPFQCLVNDDRFSHTVGVLETPFPERYPDAIRLLESFVRQ